MVRSCKEAARGEGDIQVKRTSEISRQTAETNIHLALVLDGKGESSIETGIGFFNHMLILMTKHGSFDLQLKAVGDIQVDCHHTVEDVGICLGKAVQEALGNRAGIHRYGQSLLPMDESLDVYKRQYHRCNKISRNIGWEG